jgi:hypothetical protein
LPQTNQHQRTALGRFCGKVIAEKIYRSIMVSLVLIIVVLILALIASVSYRFYRKVRVARSGPPKSLTIQRNQAVSDQLKTETKESGVTGMINCEYCGTSMPQTALTCPNCGASRRK